MNAKDFYSRYGRERCEAVALEAGTTLAYFLQLVYGNRFPSRSLAKRLVHASANEMTFEEVLLGDVVGQRDDANKAA